MDQCRNPGTSPLYSCWMLCLNHIVVGRLSHLRVPTGSVNASRKMALGKSWSLWDHPASYFLSFYLSDAKGIVKSLIDFSHQIIFEPFLSAFIWTGWSESHLAVSPQGVWWMTAVFLLLIVHCNYLSTYAHWKVILII